jgi:hypothetical protein
MLRVDGGAGRSSVGLRLLVPYVRGTFWGRKDAVHLLVRRPTNSDSGLSDIFGGRSFGTGFGIGSPASW